MAVIIATTAISMSPRIRSMIPSGGVDKIILIPAIIPGIAESAVPTIVMT